MKAILVLSLAALMLTTTSMAQNDAGLFATREIIGEKKVTAALAVTKMPEEFAAFDQAGLTKYVSVFGVHIYATADAPDEKILHAAKVVAEYIADISHMNLATPIASRSISW